MPRIRRKQWRDLSLEPGAERFALAAAVAMIDRLSLRVGNPTYARENGSYGTITLKQKHLRLRKGVLHVTFTGKGGKCVGCQLADGRMMKVLAQISGLPGAELLSWVDCDDQPRCISSASLNTYLAEAGKMGRLTARTFRTWAETVAAFGVAVDGDAPAIKAMAEAVAERLHNTPTVARNS